MRELLIRSTSSDARHAKPQCTVVKSRLQYPLWEQLGQRKKIRCICKRELLLSAKTKVLWQRLDDYSKRRICGYLRKGNPKIQSTKPFEGWVYHISYPFLQYLTEKRNIEVAEIKGSRTRIPVTPERVSRLESHEKVVEKRTDSGVL